MSENIQAVSGGGITHNGPGKPIQIIDITKDHKCKLDEEALKSILFHPKATNKKVNIHLMR
jgi:hypothetical protein